MAREILYCARCHRVILPREIDEGSYHFVDGDPVCSECFTRLSRRLRPVSGGRAESSTQPIPVNLADLERELSKGSQAARAPEDRRRERFSSRRLMAAAAPYRTGQMLFMAFCFVLGILLGGIAYSAYPVGRDKDAPEVAPPAPEKPPADPARTPAPETSKPGPGAAVKLPAAADAYVRGGKHAAERFGKTPELKVKKGEAEFTREVFLRFDLSKVDRDVTGAHLLLHVVGSEKAEGVKHEARLVGGHTWDEKTLSWDSKPSTGAAFSSWSPLKQKPVRIDVGEQVKAALRGSRQLSIGINAVTAATGWVNYGSREAADAHRPVLVLEISSKKLEPSPPVPAPTPEPKRPADGTWRLKPEADAMVAGDKNAEEKYGDRSPLKMASGEKGVTHKSYMRFKLDGVKGPIVSATLHLTVKDRGGSLGLRQQIKLVSSNAWDEKTVTWKNAPKAAGKPLHSWMLALSAKSEEIDLTEAVRAALAGGGKLSVELSPVEGQKAPGWVSYHSREGDADKSPVLVISSKPEKAEERKPLK